MSLSIIDLMKRTLSRFRRTQQRPSSSVRRTRLAVEGLEAREVPAANITAWLKDGVLLIEGSETADQIRVRQSGTYISIDEVQINMTGGQFGRVTANEVSRIEVYGLGGDDVIDLGTTAPDAVRVDSLVYGGDGNDILSGGTAADTIYGDGTRLIQAADQLGGVMQVVAGVQSTGQITFARFGSGDVYAWDARGSRLFQTAAQSGGVQQLMSAVDPDTKQLTTLARFGSGDVYAWDARGSRLVQTAAQAGGVQQLVSAVLPGGASTTLARFGSGDVYAWDARGSRLFQTAAQAGGVQQLVSAVLPGGALTTLARFGSGDVYAWDARGSRLFQTAAQSGGVRDLRSGIDPQTGAPTSLALFGNGDVYSWNAAGSLKVTPWKATLRYTQNPDSSFFSVGIENSSPKHMMFEAIDDRGDWVKMFRAESGNIYSIDDTRYKLTVRPSFAHRWCWQ